MACTLMLEPRPTPGHAVFVCTRNPKLQLACAAALALAIVAQSAPALVKQIATGEARRLFTEQGHDLVGAGPEDFAKFLRSETEQWAKVAKAAAIPKQ
jgi:tripartite-type tricarboxylate transporter receptor subunit TctC